MEEGFLNELKSRWWYDKSECGPSSSNRKVGILFKDAKYRSP